MYGGLFREEAIMLLRRFYVQENEKGMEPDEGRKVEVLIFAKPQSPNQRKTDSSIWRFNLFRLRQYSSGFSGLSNRNLYEEMDIEFKFS